MKLLISTGLTVGLLSACAEGPTSCPHLARYPPAFQAKVADQLPTLPAESRKVIEDGGELRAALRGMGCR
jgi:hypothetical protein